MKRHSPICQNKKKDTSDGKEEWRKNLGLSSEMDINVVHRYSHLGERLLRTRYNAIGIKLTGTLYVCDGCARYKAKARAVRKNTYTIVSQPGEIVFLDTTGLFPDNLIRNRYWIGAVDHYSRYSCSFFIKPSHSCQKYERFF